MARLRFHIRDWAFEPACTNTFTPNTVQYDDSGNCSLCVTPFLVTFRFEGSGEVPNTVPSVGFQLTALPGNETLVSPPASIADRQAFIATWLNQNFGGQWTVTLTGTGTAFDQMAVVGTGVNDVNLTAIRVQLSLATFDVALTKTQES